LQRLYHDIQNMRWIYISPHFDDAVLSCGGLISEQTRQGLQVEIWTILAGDPPVGPLSDFAHQNHSLWGLPGGKQTVAMRRAEDQQAADLVGADLLHFDIPDCIYRQTMQGRPLYPDTVIANPHPADRKIPERIADLLNSELLADDRLVCPLALGGHVDHVLVRQAVESLRRKLLYYTDVPYVLNNPQHLAPAIVSMVGELYLISETGLRSWLAGVAAYRSQVASLYKGPGRLEDAIRAYWASESGIHLWHIP
jgi:LmbE family N-acetylglucosaminyl deacetylase